MVWKKIISLLFLVSFITSCASVRSGHHIKLQPGDSLKRLASQYKIAEGSLRSYNKGKSFKAGEWVFIPLERGIAPNGITRKPAKMYASKGDFTWPVPTIKRMSSPFGARWGRKHEGMDIPTPIGTDIVSTADGVVVYADNEIGGYGNLLVIAHKNGYFSVYAHLHRHLVREGDRVAQGQVVALSGNTGRSTGPHLHFEIRKDSEAIDPRSLISL